LQFALAESVFRTGIEATNFFTKSFKKQEKVLADNLAEAMSEEIDVKLKFIL
jgi:hypothetical protein